MTVARGMALHKMIRLVTASTINGGYLNFMGGNGAPAILSGSISRAEGNGWSAASMPVGSGILLTVRS